MDTSGLSELGMRMPVLVAGILLVLVAPLAARRLLGRTGMLAFLALLAFSPQLIFYSRYARPYGIALFCCTLAFIAFAAWIRTRRIGWAVLLVPSAILAVYFHLLSLPFIAALFGFGILSLAVLRPPGWKRALWSTSVLGLVVVVVTGMLLAPAFLNSWGALTKKMDPPLYDESTFKLAGMLVSGVDHPWIAAGFLVVAAFGGVVFTRREGWLGGCMIFAALFQIASVLVLSPAQSHQFYIFARYNLWLLPILFFFFAAGVTDLGRGPWKLLPTAAALGVLGGFSPLAKICTEGGSFMNHARFQMDFVISKFSVMKYQVLRNRTTFAYHALAHDPEDCLILEVPWYFYSCSNFQPDVQRIHRKRVAVGILDQFVPTWLPVDERRTPRPLRFRNTLLATDCDGLRRRGVKYLFVHKRLREEITHMGCVLGMVPDWDVESCDGIWRQAFGDPIFEDRWVRVYLVLPPGD